MSGAAEPVARRLREADRRGHQRLGRRVAGDAGSREPRGAVAADRGPGAAHRRDGQGAGAAPAGLSVLCVRRGPLVRAGHRHARAPRDRRRGLGARGRLGAGPHGAAEAARADAAIASIRPIGDAVREGGLGRAAGRSRDRAAVRARATPTSSMSSPRPTRCARRSAATSCATSSTATSTTPTSATIAARSAPSPRARRTRRCAARPTTWRSTRSCAARRRPGSAAPPKCACRAASIPTTPARPISAICRAIKAALPDMHVHAFSPLEVTQGAATLGLSLRDFLARAQGRGPRHAAGHRGGNPRRRSARDHLPRQGQHGAVARRGEHRASARPAHHLDDHVRPCRAPVSWARHLLRLRDLQAETGGFTEFVPLPFVHMEAPMYLQGQARRDRRSARRC